MKKEARELHARALDSMFLAISHFNSPHDRGRVEAVLIFLDRAFELLLKATLLARGERIRDKGDANTIGMKAAIRRCVSGGKSSKPAMTEEDGLTIQNINLLRDAAQHYLVGVSEAQLFIHTQAGVTLFKRLLRDVFKDDLTRHFPDRVMPVTTVLPTDLHSVIASAWEEIKDHLKPMARQRLQACAKLRSLAILDNSVSGKASEPTEAEMKRLIQRLQKGEPWGAVFPELAKYQVVTEGAGITMALRITKNQGEPVALVPEGTPGATVVGVRRVDDLSFYSLGPSDMADKLEITEPRFFALSRQLKLKESADCFKLVKIGKSTFQRFSPKALELCRSEMPNLDMAAVWAAHKPGSQPKINSHA